MTLEEKRYVDPGMPLGAYAQSALAVCPSCTGPAFVQSRTRYAIPFRPDNARVQCLRCSFQSKQKDGLWFGPVVGGVCQRCPNCGYKYLEATERRAELDYRQRQTVGIKCPACHHLVDLQLTWHPDKFSGDAIDPAFGLPLWLQAPCCGRTLWAYNQEHLSALRSYVAAAHRERHPSGKWSMFTRLPQWVKSAKNREEILRCIGRLEQRLREMERV